MYFNYHAKAVNLIMTGHLVRYEFVEEYRGISPCLLLYFDNNIPMPIRPHRFDYYYGVITDLKR
ncbi:MAG: thermostable hemolysin delta-VPH [Clostridiales bacterium]|jgi:hypothetical protein|nr:thermostable hemolysin delta-VPH [Clostridiales bacterium]HPO53371.1 thermostable hemolysin delta-VPH [Clostridia bacterium]